MIHALRTPAVATALVYGAPALVAGWLLLAIWRPTEAGRGGPSMTAIRRTALMLALGLSSPSSAAPDPRPPPRRPSATRPPSRPTLKTTTVDAAPADVTVRRTCDRDDRDHGRDLERRAPPPGSPATACSVYFSDGFVQTVELGPTATSWTHLDRPVLRHRLLRRSTRSPPATDYGWFTESARTGSFRC